ncbi:MAG: uroporphyrinogen-III synthase [candidate division Zixibacteria bacterium]|nr:uroporphyrinogen-III synthase [candidate division Zixibacteria bacterium]
MLRIAVTRPKEQLADLTSRAAGRGIEIVPLPLISVQPVPFAWPNEFDIRSVDWVFFTSAQGASLFFVRIKALGLAFPPHTRFGAVGEKTAALLEKFVGVRPFVPSSSYGQNLFEEFAAQFGQAGQTVVYARAANVNYDPADLFSRNGIKYFPIITYETMIQKTDSSAISALGESDYILFTAPSAVDAYQSSFGLPTARSVAIGQTTAAQMSRYGWERVRVLPSPNLDLILEFAQ